MNPDQQDQEIISNHPPECPQCTLSMAVWDQVMRTKSKSFKRHIVQQAYRKQDEFHRKQLSGYVKTYM